MRRTRNLTNSSYTTYGIRFQGGDQDAAAGVIPVYFGPQ